MHDIAKEFENYFNDNKSCFEMWGEFVANEIKKQLAEKISPQPIEQVLKIEVQSRVKQLSSALAKIGRKRYQNPISEMTDLVGVRFVVLLKEQIDLICKIIENSNIWLAKVSKDFTDDIKDNPKLFDYQSKHYELRPKNNFSIREKIISTEICCEVQVRTILQHAYAELVHDSIYKPKGNVPKRAEREVAKSMALMETTDDLFSNTLKLLEESNKFEKETFDKIKNIYIKLIDNNTHKMNEKINLIIINDYKELIKEDFETGINNLMNEKKFIINKIKENSEEMFLYQQPVIFLLYYLTHICNATTVQKNWSLPIYSRQLSYVFSDLDTQP